MRFRNEGIPFGLPLHDRRENITGFAAIDPIVVHQRRANATATVRMAPDAVVLLVELLALRNCVRAFLVHVPAAAVVGIEFAPGFNPLTCTVLKVGWQAGAGGRYWSSLEHRHQHRDHGKRAECKPDGDCCALLGSAAAFLRTCR